MIILNHTTSLIFFTYRAGRPMTEDRSGAFASPDSVITKFSRDFVFYLQKSGYTESGKSEFKKKSLKNAF